MNKRKLLKSILNNDRNVKFADFISVAELFGFRLSRTEGSHNIFKHGEISEFINIQNVKGQAKPYQIKQFFALVEKYNLKMEGKR